MDFTDLLKYFQNQHKEERILTPEEMEKQQFLDATRVLESGGEKDPLNTVHPSTNTPMHGNERAFGAYGLMPNTIRLLLKKKKEEVGPNLSDLSSAPEKELRGLLKNNEPLQRELAGDYYDRMKNLHPELDDERAQFMYKAGYNRKPEDITEEKLNKSERVQRYRNLKKKLQNK